jgi:cytidyltransferase-like protein
MKYSMFIGRWQPLHAGHLWLIQQRLKEGKNVCLAIRDVEPNENQPWTAQEIEKMVH